MGGEGRGRVEGKDRAPRPSNIMITAEIQPAVAPPPGHSALRAPGQHRILSLLAPSELSDSTFTYTSLFSVLFL